MALSVIPSGEDFYIFDNMPPEIRYFLNYSPIGYNAKQIAPYMINWGMSPQQVIAALMADLQRQGITWDGSI